jgi:hypothetical protein
LFGQFLAEVQVVLERIGLAAGAVQRERDLAGQTLVQRITGGLGG